MALTRWVGKRLIYLLLLGLLVLTTSLPFEMAIFIGIAYLTATQFWSLGPVQAVCLGIWLLFCIGYILKTVRSVRFTDDAGRDYTPLTGLHHVYSELRAALQCVCLLWRAWRRPHGYHEQTITLGPWTITIGLTVVDPLPSESPDRGPDSAA